MMNNLRDWSELLQDKPGCQIGCLALIVLWFSVWATVGMALALVMAEVI